VRAVLRAHDSKASRETRPSGMHRWNGGSRRAVKKASRDPQSVRQTCRAHVLPSSAPALSLTRRRLPVVVLQRDFFSQQRSQPQPTQRQHRVHVQSGEPYAGPHDSAQGFFETRPPAFFDDDERGTEDEDRAGLEEAALGSERQYNGYSDDDEVDYRQYEQQQHDQAPYDHPDVHASSEHEEREHPHELQPPPSRDSWITGREEQQHRASRVAEEPEGDKEAHHQRHRLQSPRSVTPEPVKPSPAARKQPPVSPEQPENPEQLEKPEQSGTGASALSTLSRYVLETFALV
jgi:hypothetical protein